MRKGRVLTGLLVGGILGTLAGLRLAEGDWKPKASTCRLWQAVKEAKQPWWRFIHTYFYARWPYGYIGAAIAEKVELGLLRPFFAPFLVKALFPQPWGNSYHGKVMPTAEARKLVTVREEVKLTVPQQVIPFASARELILSADNRIVVLDCPCRVARKDPCLPLDVCLIVGEPFAGFVLEHHPSSARSITSAEAVAILEAEARRGHVHHAFFKEAMLERFYAICNCCSCCCGAMTAHQHDIPMLISSGYVSRVDEKRCKGCGACARICPFEAIRIAPQASVDAGACMGCGVCVKACQNGALRLVRDERKPAPLEIPA